MVGHVGLLIDRPRLRDRLAANASGLVLVLAPTGYGKTTFIKQWCQSWPGPVMMLTVSSAAADRDSLGRSLFRAAPAAGLDLGSLSSRAESVAPSWLSTAIPGFADRVAHRRALIVIDDVHLVAHGEAIELIEALLAHRPGDTTVALVGQRMPNLRSARRRLIGDVAMVTADDLQLSEQELLDSLPGNRTDEDQVWARTVWQHTGGWPVGIRVAMASRLQPTTGHVSDEWELPDYIDDEVLGGLHPIDQQHLQQLAVLPQLPASRCDEILGSDNTAAVLERIRRINIAMTEVQNPVDPSVFIHGLLRDHLRRRFERENPGGTSRLLRRAVRIAQEHSEPELAFNLLLEIQDRDLLRSFIYRWAREIALRGSAATVRGWLREFSDKEQRTDPLLALANADLFLGEGRRKEMLKALEPIEHVDFGPLPNGLPSVAEAIRLMKVAAGLMPSTGELTDIALSDGSWWLLEQCVRGLQSIALGRLDRAVQRLSSLDDVAVNFPQLNCTRHSFLALAHIEAEQWHQANQALDQALEIRVTLRQGEARHTFLCDALVARLAMQRGDHDMAQTAMTTARKKLADMDAPERIGTAFAFLLLSEVAAGLDNHQLARMFHSSATSAVTPWPTAVQIWTRLREIPQSAGDDAQSDLNQPLTSAELRVLRELPTHFSLSEIASRLYVARSTVKTHVNSVYRKLGATSRGQAVQIARGLGLLDY